MGEWDKFMGSEAKPCSSWWADPAYLTCYFAAKDERKAARLESIREEQEQEQQQKKRSDPKRALQRTDTTRSLASESGRVQSLPSLRERPDSQMSPKTPM